MFQKAIIIGCPGAGKSTFARILSDKTHLPLYYLDMLWHKPDRTTVDRITFDKKLKKITLKDKWIIDGNYAKFCQERRLEEADLIVFMDYTRRICLWQAVKRYLEYRDKTRESMAEGCREKIDWEFVKWILRDGRDENHSYRSIKARYPHKTLVVRNRKQLKDSMTRLILRSRERTLG